MWLNKYKPEILDEFVGNRNIVYRLNKWYKEDEGNIVIINGQTGIGKTLLSELFLKENNFTINTFSNCEEKSINIIKEKHGSRKARTPNRRYFRRRSRS